MIPAIKDATTGGKGQALLQALTHFSDDREAEIEKICNSNHQEFTASVSQLLKVRQGGNKLATDITDLNKAIQTSTEKLADQKRSLKESRAVRSNIDDSTAALDACLEVLRLANYVHDLLGQKNHYAALRALDELQSIHLQAVSQYKIASMIQKSVPATKKLIADAVMTDLNMWLFRIRETSQFVGELAFYSIEQRRTRHKERSEKLAYLANYKLNSAIELVADENDEFDVLNNEDVQVNFTPLFECLHIHNALGQTDKFKMEYAATRKQQKDLMLPASITLVDPESSSLSEMLESIAGFAIIEKATLQKLPNLRSSIDVDELWESMCQSAINVISRALADVNNAEMLLKIKGVIALFIQTMDSWGYQVRSLDSFLLTLFGKYAELLKRRFGDDFQEIVMTDDYMPMPINNGEEYDKVVNVSWYTPEKSREEIRFPCVLPFSQMYPLCCIDIRNFLNRFYFFSDDHFQQPKVIDDALRNSLDELLAEKVCHSLVERLGSQYLGQIVQILINLEHFEVACRELEQLLAAARSSSSAGGHVALSATEQFKNHKKTAEKRIFELVNSKIDDLVDTADYDWVAQYGTSEPSSYMQELTQYLSTTMATVLIGLPTEIKELIYFNALSHAAEKVLSLPLSSSVRRINPNGVAALATDVKFLSAFAETLGNPILQENLDELRQTVALMQSGNTDEYYDVSTRNKKYGRVNALHGPLLLEKLTQAIASPSRAEKFSTFSSKFYSRDT